MPDAPAIPPASEANPSVKSRAERRIEVFLEAQHPLPLLDVKAYQLDGPDVAPPTLAEALAVAEGTAEPTTWAMASAARSIVSHDARFAKVLFGIEQSKTVEDVGPDDELVA